MTRPRSTVSWDRLLSLTSHAIASLADDASWNRTRAVPYVPLEVIGLYSTETCESDLSIPQTYNLAVPLKALEQRQRGFLLLDKAAHEDGSIVNVTRLAVDDFLAKNTTTVSENDLTFEVRELVRLETRLGGLGWQAGRRDNHRVVRRLFVVDELTHQRAAVRAALAAIVGRRLRALDGRKWRLSGRESISVASKPMREALNRSQVLRVSDRAEHTTHAHEVTSLTVVGKTKQPAAVGKLIGRHNVVNVNKVVDQLWEELCKSASLGLLHIRLSQNSGGRVGSPSAE